MYAREIEFPSSTASCRGEHSVLWSKSVFPPSSSLRPPPTSSWISAVESLDQATSISSTVRPKLAAPRKHPNFTGMKINQVCDASELLQFEEKKLVQSKYRTFTEDDAAVFQVYLCGYIMINILHICAWKFVAAGKSAQNANILEPLFFPKNAFFGP